MRARLLLLTITGAALSGLACSNSPDARINTPPHGESEKTSDLQGTFVYMNDNAMLADMNLSDMHFMPHRALLTSLGEERLSRLAELMKAYGGELRYNTDLSADDPLRGKRVAAIVEFLNETGLKTTPDAVHFDEPGGRGMPASSAVLIKANEGTYKPKKSSGGAGGGAADAVGGSSDSNK